MLGFFNERKLVIETRKAVFSQPDVLQIGDGRAFQHRSLFGELNFRLPQNCQAETKPRLLPMCCYAVVLSSVFTTVQRV